MSIECLCVKRGSGTLRSTGGILRAKMSCNPAMVKARGVIGTGSIKARCGRTRNATVNLLAVATIVSRASSDIHLGGVWQDPPHPDTYFPPQFGQERYSVTCTDNLGNEIILDVDKYGLETLEPSLECSIGASYLSTPTPFRHYGSPFTLTARGGGIDPGLTQSHGPYVNLVANGTLRVPYTDKFAGDFNDFGCSHKLYPIDDIDVSFDGGDFVDEGNSNSGIYDSVDEGIFTGSYHTPFGNSFRISDDLNTFIQPSAIYTTGKFRYKCEVTNPSYTAKDSRLYMRASAPMSNYSSRIPPEYRIENVLFEDPSGNLIIKYSDFKIRGDADYDNYQYVNFGTYGSKPVINNLLLHTWQDGYPFMEEGSGYTLSFEVDVHCFDDPFDEGFETGFEDTCTLDDSIADDDDYLALDGAPLATQTQRLSFLNPTNTLRISAIEICNSGGFETIREDYVPFHLGVEDTGRRLERCILPSVMPIYGFDEGIYPTVSSIWEDPSSSFTNQSGVGAGYLTSLLRSSCVDHAITLESTYGVADSGKLFLEFKHERPRETLDWRAGEFAGGYSKAEFSVAYMESLFPQNDFFTIESISLKVLAKKQVDSRDYALDIVGWSDDRLLNVTSAVGGFLQNPSGSEDNFSPLTSGFNPTDELALGGESLSDKHQYYEASGTCNDGGDHYILTNTPTVTGTSFEWYDVPLTIYDDCITLGQSPDYSQSPYFEHLFLDIFPLPSGATISSAQLCITYKPTTALTLNTVGGEKISRIKKYREEGKVFPTARQIGDDIINAGPEYAPISKIENIPHAYKTPHDIKSNYSRRWRGLEGIVQGPFDPDEFNFGFDNPLLDYPFLSGFYNFDYDEDMAIHSIPLGSGFGTLSGVMHTNYEEHHFKSLGWRFNTSGIFDEQLPGFSGDYRTADWTSLYKDDASTHHFRNHELYGQIADAFNNVVRISGHNSYIDFGDIETTSGFSIYTRFIPDSNISGVDGSYDLFSSGVIFSKWDASKQLEFALGYDGGYLCGYAQDDENNLITVKDTVLYSGYQYPLSVLLTYNDNLSSGLKLYTDNELHSGVFNTLRASSDKFYKKTGDSSLILGHSFGSGVGMNMLVSEFGIGTYHVSGAHLVESNADLTFKDVVADNFLRGHRMKFWGSGEPVSSEVGDEIVANDRYQLWNYVNEDTLDWNLGAFKLCEFNRAFDYFTKRAGRDLISINIKHDGSGYTQRTNLQLPSSINYADVAYHTQIENDFLRFNLSNSMSNFYSPNQPRITKNLPDGYHFSDRAFVVETVLEHSTYNPIRWSDGLSGPKLIVSLYTKNQEPDSYPTENWGLINRAIHTLKPSGCLMRLDSTFDSKSLFDVSEPWAVFPEERYLTEFTRKYYSQDIDDMFLQYDLVYPSGEAFESRINIHSSHVRLENAFVTPEDVSGNLNLITSGEKRPRESLNLHAISICTMDNLASGHPQFCSGNLPGVYPSGLILYTQGPTKLSADFQEASGMILYASGASGVNEFLTFHSITLGGTADSSSGDGDNGNGPLAGASGPLAGASHGGGAAGDGSWGSGSGMSLYVSGQIKLIEELPLSILNTQTANIPGDVFLALNTYSAADDGVFMSIPFYLLNVEPPTQRAYDLNSMNLHVLARGILKSDYADNLLDLFVHAPHLPTGYLDLALWNDVSLDPDLASDQLNLHTATFGGGLGSSYMVWNKYNYGYDIQIDDNSYSRLSADDEIRGVDLICYGACDATDNVKCNEKALYTHDTVWREEECVNGGILRARGTYTNVDTGGFNTDIGYSGHYYGIRKFIDLKPASPYTLTVRGTTGTNTHIKLPREWEEWEYGAIDDMQFSGIKFAGDYPYLSGQYNITPPSGRNAKDLYGKSVAVKGNLMAVGAPHHEYDELGGTTYFDSGINSLAWVGGSGLFEAGAIYLYRREEQILYPNTHPISGHKALWELEDKVVLPSAYRADWFTQSIGNMSFGNLPRLPVRVWNIGQEGRQLGHSIGLARSENNPSLYEDEREILVAGSPEGRWLRKFDSVVTTPIKVALIVFTDEFKYKNNKGAAIKAKADAINMIFRYYADPPIELDIQVLVAEPVGLFGDHSEGMTQELPDFIHHQKINRCPGIGICSEDTKFEVLSGIKSFFHDVFPYDDTKLHNGIPPMVGFYVDNSRSLGRRSLTPAVDDFADYYKWYSHASGVEDVYGVIDSGHIHEYIPSVGDNEDWVLMSNTLADDLLDSGRLMTPNSEEGPLRFLCEGLGLEFQNPNLTEFNLPPSSGGRVYIFEKESGSWNLIQEIQRPFFEWDGVDGTGDEAVSAGISAGDPGGGDVGLNEDEGWLYRDFTPFDGFGHAVAISDDTEVISVGSPYIEECCLIYEHDPDEKARLYKHIDLWLKYKNDDGIYDTVLLRMDEYIESFGIRIASEMIYTELSASEKFAIRSDKDYWDTHKQSVIMEYQKIFEYGYQDIPHTGTWAFIPSTFAPTSRLGYSTSVDTDGGVVVFGAPTDSFNEFDDTNVYYKGYNTWASYVNAGAVRVFESRKYHKHSEVVEFYKFGNLDESTRAADQRGEDYHDLKSTFAIGGETTTGSDDDEPMDAEISIRSFRRTKFSDLEIPRSAGLAFIITPEIDAASDEVIENIKDWLALGDRTLVLVGNDPVWEDDGKYAESNEIINKILGKLDSRMRLHPARSEYESLPDCMDSGRPNTLPSFFPAQGRGTAVQPQTMFAKGVADIKIHLPTGWPGSWSPCDKLNYKCELPLIHNGDLRAQWNSECATSVPKCDVEVKYKTNWPWEFATAPNPCEDCSPNLQAKIGPNEEPKPLVVAAEYMPPVTIVYPAWDEVRSKPVWCRRWVEHSSTRWNFSEKHIEEVAFSWSEDNRIYKSLDEARYFNPSPDEDRDAVLQAEAKSKDNDPPVKDSYTVLPESTMVAEEAWGNNNTSKVVMVAAVTTESEDMLSDRLGLYGGADWNISFYINLIMKGCTGETVEPGWVKQLGGFTKRTSFRDAYPKSCLGAYTDSNGASSLGLFGSDFYGCKLEENYDLADLVTHNSNIDQTWNTCWIANSRGLPTEAELKKLTDWLDSGNKTLVITYANEMICDRTLEGEFGCTDCSDVDEDCSPSEILGKIAPSQRNARVAHNLCQMLNLKMHPAYLNGAEKYAEYRWNVKPVADAKQKQNEELTTINGCGNLLDHVDRVIVDKDDIPLKQGCNFIQIDRGCRMHEMADGTEMSGPMHGENQTCLEWAAKNVVWYLPKVRDEIYRAASPYWQMKPGIAEMDVDVLPHSGYRLFYSWVSEAPNE